MREIRFTQTTGPSLQSITWPCEHNLGLKTKKQSENEVEVNLYGFQILDHNTTFLHLKVTLCIIVGPVLLTICLNCTGLQERTTSKTEYNF